MTTALYKVELLQELQPPRQLKRTDSHQEALKVARCHSGIGTCRITQCRQKDDILSWVESKLSKGADPARLYDALKRAGVFRRAQV